MIMIMIMIIYIYSNNKYLSYTIFEISKFTYIRVGLNLWVSEISSKSKTSHIAFKKSK